MKISPVTTEKQKNMHFNRTQMLNVGVFEERGMKCSSSAQKECNAHSGFRFVLIYCHYLAMVYFVYVFDHSVYVRAFYLYPVDPLLI